MTRHAILALALAGLALTGAGSVPADSASSAGRPRTCDLPQGSDPVALDPADLSTTIDNPYWPMAPGTVWHYIEKGGGETQSVTVKVSRRTKVVAGIRTRVVHDVVRDASGRLVENTWDWFAQDQDGNVWYLGEFTREYDDGVVVSTDGSWKHGRDGAQAGVVVPAAPRVGCGYREEYLEGEAEDQARVLSTTEVLKTPTGLHREVVQTANTTPLEPNLLENKFYARGIGPVLELDLSPALGRAVLVRMENRKLPR